MKNIYMIGDSTMQYNNFQTYPQVGWGQVLHLFAHEDVTIHDYAKNGRSTKSFIDEGRFDKVLSHLTEGDFVICQFGHNDEKIEDKTRGTYPDTTYIENLKFFYEKVVEKKATFILATSISRRKFIDGVCQDTHKGYPQAMLKFAKEYNILCIDLNQMTLDLYNELGEEETKKFHMIFPAGMYYTYPEGKEDGSHLRFDGAFMVAKLFVEGLFKTNSAMKDLFYAPDSKADIDWAMLID